MRGWIRNTLGASLLLAGLTGGLAPSLAGNLDLASNALELVTGVEPNVFVLVDNSGSMDLELLTQEGEISSISGAAGTIIATVSANNYFGYFYVFDGSDNSYNYDSFSGGGGVVPDATAVAAVANAESQTAMEGLWRARLYAYNKAYYNPDRTYAIWSGVDNTGTAYANATPTAARNNPYNSGDGTVDLTANWTVTTRRPLGTSEGSGTTTMTFTYYPAIYYVCTAADNTTEQSCPSSSSDITATSGHKLVTITSSTNSYTHSNTRTDCSTDNGNSTVTCTYAEEIQNFANWYSYHRRRELAAKAAISNLVESAYAARIGFATINNTDLNRIAVASMNVASNTGNKKTLLDTVYGMTSTGGTDLLDALLKTGYYFQCASGDIMGSSSSSSPGNIGCPVQASPAGKCEQNYTILLSDGYYTDTGDVPGSGANENTDQDGGSGVSSNFDGGAFADTYSNTMGDLAMYFYEQDLHNTLDDEVPTTTTDTSRYPSASELGDTMHQHMALYTIGFGVSGSLSAMPTTPTSGFTWPDPSSSSTYKIDDMRHAAYNGRGSYLDATDPVTLDDELTSIFDEIMAGVGAASSVAFNTQEIESGAVVFRAFFNTKTNSGDLVSQNVNVDGSIDDAINWSSADELDSKASASTDSRIIITYNDTGSGTSGGIPFQWNDLNGNQHNALHNPIPASVSNWGDERLGYLRGQTQYEGTSYDSGQFRARPSESGKLGDIVHSSPVFVGEPNFVGRNADPYPTTSGSTYSEFSSAYEDRTQVVYTGANDGMLHAFRATDGVELFAYVPNALFSATGSVYPLSLLTKPDYTHRYYVDISPAIGDVFITRTGSASPAWKTVLVGGLGGGGKGYFALDVTDPTTFTSESTADDNVMWEFTEADDGSIGNSDLGYTYSRPVLVMTNSDDTSGNNKWAAIFGNGYNSTSSDGDAALYIAFLSLGQDGVWSSGSDYIKISTGYGKAESSDGTTPNGLGGVRAVDYDGNGTADYVYAGDLQGNVFRFDISNSSTGQWTTNNMKRIFQAKYKADSSIQPVTNTPVAVKHSSGGLIVIFGTGRWFTTDDATSTGIQSIYGIWDDLSNSPLVYHTSATDQLVEQVLANQVTQVNGYTVRTLTSNTVTWKNTGAAASQVKGWVIDLDVYTSGTTTVQYPGERAIRNFQLRGDFVFVNTVIPKSSSACTTGPGGYEFGFDPETGGAPDTIIFDLNGDGSFDDSDNVDGQSGSTYRVVGVRFDNATPADAAFIGKMRVTQTSDQEVRTISTNTGDSGSTGRLSWREINP